MDNRELKLLLDTMDERDKLKERLRDMKEAAEFWAKKHDDLYKKYIEHSEEVDIRLDSIKENIECIIVNYNLAQEILSGIIRDYSNPNMTYFNAASRAFDCLYQISKNNEKRKNEKEEVG